MPNHFWQQVKVGGRAGGDLIEEIIAREICENLVRTYLVVQWIFKCHGESLDRTW